LKKLTNFFTFFITADQEFVVLKDNVSSKIAGYSNLNGLLTPGKWVIISSLVPLSHGMPAILIIRKTAFPAFNGFYIQNLPILFYLLDRLKSSSPFSIAFPSQNNRFVSICSEDIL
jgi:hypothetical protein